MKNIKQNIKIFLAAAFLLLAGACRKEQTPFVGGTTTLPNLKPDPNSVVKGMYVLNEGNMNMNKASLDYLDFRTGLYHSNIYNSANPTIVKSLGDVGNDIAVYGAKVYVVVNNSKLVEVLNAKTAKHIATISILNCRNFTCYENKAYVSAYLVKVGDPNYPNGAVYEIDTTSLTITRNVTVGRQPEEMAIVGEKLYVANSGGYSPPNYENTLSVIDLNSFTEIKRIVVAINLEKVKADQYGDLYVTSRGDYYTIPPDLYVIDTKTDQVKKDFKLPVSNLWIDGDMAYMYSVAFSYETGKNTISYSMINVKDETVLDKQFITDGTDKQITVPYGIAVNPVTKEVYVADAKNYVISGSLSGGVTNCKKEWSITAGDIPGHFAFIY